MRKLLGFCLLALLFASPACAANTHGRPDVMGEMQSWFGDGFRPYVVSGTCIPAIPASSLTFAPFACNGYVRGTVADLVYVAQVARAVGPFSGGDGTYWLALHRDTSTSIASWTRQQSTAYLWQKASTQPTTPANALIFGQVTVTGGVITGYALVTATNPVSGALLAIQQGCVNVQDFGANPDDAIDDTAAIQAAIASIKGTDNTGGYYTDKGTGCLFLPLPTTIAGHYRISDTLDFTAKWNIAVVAPARYQQSRNAVDASRLALLRWYGGTNKAMFLFHDEVSIVLQNLTVDCRDIAGTIGFAFGADYPAVDQVNSAETRNLVASHCDTGFRVGDNNNGGPNVAQIQFYNPFGFENKSAGLRTRSGNAQVEVYSGTFFSNGYAPIGDHVGANVEHGSGELTMYGTTLAGGADGGHQPTIASIWCGVGGLRLVGGWDESLGVSINCGGGNTTNSVISGWRHYNGQMTDANTPTSVIWTSADPLIIDGIFFNNIQVDQGANSVVHDLGVRFYYDGAGATHVATNIGGTTTANATSSLVGAGTTFATTLIPGDKIALSSAPSTLCIVGIITDNTHLTTQAGCLLGDGTSQTINRTHVPTFTGTATLTSLAYGGFAGAGATQNVALVLGKPLRTDAGRITQQVTTPERQPFLSPCTTDAGIDNCGSMGYQASLGGYNLWGNAYFDGTNIKSVSAGAMTWLRIQGGPDNNTVVGFYRDTATAGGQTKFLSSSLGTARVWEIAFDVNGVGAKPALRLGANLITFGTGAPTQGAHIQGDIVYNNSGAFASGQPEGWRCTASGTPGTWSAMGNHP